MKVKCLGSSSSGNCYLLQFSTPDGDYNEKIMIEAGFSWSEITKRATANNAITFLKNAKNVLITHNHLDHCLAVPELIKRSYKVYATKEVFEKKKIDSFDLYKKEIEPNKDYCIAPELFIYTFQVEHDAPNSIGFVIWCKATDERILFINDCKYVTENLSAWRFTYIFIECNYEDKQTYTLYNMAKKENDRVKLKQYERVINAHMGLANCKRTLLRLNLSCCKAIFLMHLSERHANEYLMKKTIKEETKIDTYVCQKNGGIK